MGELHPIIVHFAVTLLFIAPLLFWLTQLRLLHFLKDLVGPINGLGSGMGIIALWTGWQLATTGFYAGDDFENHRFLAFAVVIIGAIATALLFFGRHETIFSGYLIKLLLLAQGVLILVTGNKGGVLTHGNKPWIKTPKTLSLDKMEESFTIYDGLIQPIFDSKCVACHQEGNKSGGLALVNFESLMEGGSSGPVIEAGEVYQSLLFERITLSKSSTKYMPPTGWPLNYDEINLIAHWIATGAEKESNLIDHPLTDVRLISYVEEVYGVKNGFQSKIEKQNGPVWTEDVENILKKYPQHVKRIAANTNWLSLKIDSFYSKELLEEVSNITTSIAWIAAGKSNITIEDFTLLGPLPNLVRLSLDYNSWDNQAVSQLVDYPSIEFLNLYANPVGEEGIIRLLNGANSMKKLIIGSTLVKEGEKSGIIKNYPGIEVI
ncbi:MAG: c-type cytochrome domain-containing protein [Saprospiraceae bacterium]